MPLLPAALALLLTAAQPGEIPLRVERLDNGLNVTVYTDDVLPLVSVQVWLDGGWLNGFTPPDSALPDQIWAYIRHERRVYAEHTLLSWTGNRVFLKELLEHAARIILNPEPGQEPYETVGLDRDLRKRLFKTDPPPKPIPNVWAGRIVVIGACQAAEIVPTLREATKAIKWRDQPRLPPFLSPKESKTEPTGKQVAFAVAGLGASEHAAQEALLHHIRLAEDLPLKGGIEWTRDLWSGGGVLLVRGQGLVRSDQRDHRDEQAGTQLIATLKHLATNPIQPAELRQALAQTEAASRNSFGSFHKRAIHFGEHEAIAGDILLADLARDRIPFVRAADLQTAAERLLQVAFAPPNEQPAGARWSEFQTARLLKVLPEPRQIIRHHMPQHAFTFAGCQGLAVQWPQAAFPVVVWLDQPSLYGAFATPIDLSQLMQQRGIDCRGCKDGLVFRGQHGDELALLEIAARIAVDRSDNARFAIVSRTAPTELIVQAKQLNLAPLPLQSPPPQRTFAGPIQSAWSSPTCVKMSAAEWCEVPGLLDLFLTAELTHKRLSVTDPNDPDLLLVATEQRALRSMLSTARRQLWLDAPELLAIRLASAPDFREDACQPAATSQPTTTLKPAKP